MRPVRFLSCGVLPVALFMLACGPSEPSYGVMHLPSGKQVKVLSVGKMHFTRGDPAMVLTYQTDLSLDDVAALAAEVDNIWDVFKVDVEAQHLNNALIKPTRITFGGVVSKSRGFVYEKQPDGSWHRLSDQ